MRLEDHGLHTKIWMSANDLIKKGHSNETAFIILRDACNKMDRFVPDREIWSAIHDARRRTTPLWRRLLQQDGLTEEEIEVWKAHMDRLMAEFRQRQSQRTREEIEADEARWKRAEAEYEALPQSEREQIEAKFRRLV
jgi:hypothetical protein